MSAKFKILIHDLSQALQNKNYNEIPYLLNSYNSLISDWNTLSVENLNSNCKYTRNNLLNLPNNLGQILILIWKSNCNSNVHFHPNSECWVKVLNGKLEENIFQDNKLISTNSILLNDVSHINDSIGSHSMHNRSLNNRAVTLHVYSNNDNNNNNIEIFKNFQNLDLHIYRKKIN
ncbi:hypothetical protein C6P40_000533 [Pichia californica]|uniref:Cysteine dioxygenase n=1 Tax=Pichia californica TaxID=460514 RepID=A0A9P6WKX1_9ASCO|nr:hypothetical protein C6P42_003091 [[Candida] californica]KAG0688799.1 hypothetical protein C6P40_000533 [[Candida] californica]